MVTTREKRFMRYSAVGFCTFLLDVILLYIIVNFFHISYLVGTPCVFIGAISLNYILSRRIVFIGSSRGYGAGYLYFLVLAIIGALLTTGGMWVLIEVFSLGMVVARVLVAAIIGIGNYIMNLYVNFKVVGYEL